MLDLDWEVGTIIFWRQNRHFLDTIYIRSFLLISSSSEITNDSSCSTTTRTAVKVTVAVYHFSVFMEVAERLWLDCDVDGALREVSAVLLTAQDKSKTDVNNALLLSAHIHFYLGKLRQSNELLNQSMSNVFNKISKRTPSTTLEHL